MQCFVILGFRATLAVTKGTNNPCSGVRGWGVQGQVGASFERVVSSAWGHFLPISTMLRLVTSKLSGYKVIKASIANPT